jgi:Rieske Fe-S protein
MSVTAAEEGASTVTEIDASRRNLVAGLAAAGVAVPILAACGSSADTTGTTDPAGSSGSSGSGGSGGSGTGSSQKSGGNTIPTSEIPVGGGKIFASRQIVVTQPAAGEFKAFSAICTHQGCLVSQVADGTIDCPCHGSMFSIKDGSVEGGLATRALPEMKVTVSGSSLTVT